MSDLMFRLGIRVQGRPLLRLVTVGARTGKRRHAVLGWFPDGERTDSWLVVASAGGAVRHPGWAHNLSKNPTAATVDLGDGELAVVAEQLDAAERGSMWNQVLKFAPGYGRYTEKTDREIPIFRLTRRP